MAKMAGLPGIIVHGLCTMAFTSKVTIDKLCGGDPTRLKRLRVRFSRPVFPGQTITTKVWQEGERDGRKIYAYETYNPEGHAVIEAESPKSQSDAVKITIGLSLSLTGEYAPMAGRPKSRYASSSLTPTRAAHSASPANDASSPSNATTTRAIPRDAPKFIARYAPIAAPTSSSAPIPIKLVEPTPFAAKHDSLRVGRRRNHSVRRHDCGRNRRHLPAPMRFGRTRRPLAHGMVCRQR